MTGRRSPDSRLRDALAAKVPTEAPSGLFVRIMDSVEVTPQVRRAPTPLAPILDADRTGRQRLMLLVAAVLIALLTVAIGAGALRFSGPAPGVPLVQIPAELHGRWEAHRPGSIPDLVPGVYSVDLRAPSLVKSPDGVPVVRLGRLASVARQTTGSRSTFAVEIDAECGRGRYTVQLIGQPGDRVRFDADEEPCAERAALLTGPEWEFGTPFIEPTLGPMPPGGRYTSGAFTEPFTFSMPTVSAAGANTGLGTQFYSGATTYVSEGGLRFGGAWWGMVILDDVPVSADLCDVTSDLLPDIPATADAVEAWLRRDHGHRIVSRDEVPVDGRVAVRFDLEETAARSTCRVPRLPPGGYFAYGIRVYAIPTPRDMIVAFAEADSAQTWVDTAPPVDAIIRSIHFTGG
jgi:hypothetical protein